MPDGSSNAFMFKPAVRENTPIVMALAGASGSGKTFTALELAMGLAGDGKIAVIDTEGRRALHYADLRDGRTGEKRFRFDHCEMRPPFSPDRFLEAMHAAERAGYRVIVIDSFSDEHEGEGGLIDMAAAGKSDNTAANWARPKAQHKLIVRWLRQTRCHVLFCLRAEERVKIEKVFDERRGREVTAVVPQGWQPICEKRFMFDMTASFLLDPKKPGIPEPIKLQEQHRRFFPDGDFVTRAIGRQLAEWATGGSEEPAEVIDGETGEVFDTAALAAQARAFARQGWKVLSVHLKSLTDEAYEALRPLIGTRDDPGELRKIAAEADRKQRDGLEDAFGPPPLGERGEAQQGPPAGERERDEDWWNQEAVTLSATAPREFHAEMHQRVLEARNWAEIERLRDDNGERIDQLDRATKQDVLGLLADRERELRNA